MLIISLYIAVWPRDGGVGYVHLVRYVLFDVEICEGPDLLFY